ncbi:unnamed protein product [Penicillium nalgiovense]|nr:unnamed protein product [Penicillium nalgiovense]CAG8291650.1 unnamed protein product [Penicillium nalgiovense]CAG8302548.1 unnamed protein product [Penicillium nalgiovense]CAG8944106.1 unnamed protein product [Penicillium nalgiovense]CAH0471933.1 unnamed protein product [Penicillium nalgiovense]
MRNRTLDDYLRHYLNQSNNCWSVKPTLEQTASEQVIVLNGEVFCRITNCEYCHVPPSTIGDIRKHGVMVARNPPGRISNGGQDVAVAWFRRLFAANEETTVDKEDHGDE